MHWLSEYVWAFMGFGLVGMTISSLFVYRVVMALRRQRAIEMLYREQMAMYWQRVEAGDRA